MGCLIQCQLHAEDTQSCFWIDGGFIVTLVMYGILVGEDLVW
jgi:hypothetical protein